ncbi:MAG: uracil-DNA glycosylase [Nitrospirae bacterium]|nr:uracil-DNA glycosylase [Nitrospirota bacterium]
MTDITIHRIIDILKDLNALEIKNIPHNLKYSALQNAKLDVLNCSNCSLKSIHSHKVFGEGNPYASLMIIGDPPDENEEKLSTPFVGAHGDIFSSLINKLGLKRSDIYITNIIKCRPDNLIHDDLSNCLIHLNKQIEIICPSIIMTMGDTAAKFLLSTDKDVSEIRGKFYDYNGIKVMPTFHTSTFISLNNLKSLTWSDAQLILKELKLSA